MLEHPGLLETEKKDVHIVATQHFDILWRKPLSYYRQIQTDVIKRVLEIVDEYPKFRFAFHQANVLRHFIEKNPLEAKLLKKCVQEGSIEVAGGMEAIPDTNMVSGESLVRNIMYGKQWIQNYFGVEPSVGSLLDCFGSSGQLPQIFVGTGHQALLAGRMPGVEFSDTSSPAVFLWRGLDGTTIKGVHINYDMLHENIQGVWYGWGVLEGFDELYESAKQDSKRLIEGIHLGLNSIISNSKSETNVLAVMSGEEHLPRKEVVDAASNFQHDNGYVVNFSTFQNFIGETDWVRQVNQLEGEYNVEFSGCYTTRIELKQKTNVRKQPSIMPSFYIR